MKITKISQQVKRANRYSVFVDDAYAFSLSETALLESSIASGQEVTSSDVENYKQLSQDDKLYGQALRYVAMRAHTIWEVHSYLEKKQAPPPLIDGVITKLVGLGLLDDLKYAESFVRDHRNLRSSSRRKITAGLKQKRVADSIIQAALSTEGNDEFAALLGMVERKRRQTKYHDDTKLLQYLARQGFNYDDIKRALAASQD